MLDLQDCLLGFSEHNFKVLRAPHGAPTQQVHTGSAAPNPPTDCPLLAELHSLLMTPGCRAHPGHTPHLSGQLLVRPRPALSLAHGHWALPASLHHRAGPAPAATGPVRATQRPQAHPGLPVLAFRHLTMVINTQAGWGSPAVPPGSLVPASPGCRGTCQPASSRVVGVSPC